MRAQAGRLRAFSPARNVFSTVLPAESGQSGTTSRLSGQRRVGVGEGGPCAGAAFTGGTDSRPHP